MATDLARGREGFGVGVFAPLAESVRAHTVWLVDKWDEEAARWAARRSGLLAPSAAVFERLKIRPFETCEVLGNLVTTAGWTRFTSLMIAGGGQAATNTSMRIGAGNGSTAAAAGDTDLSAAAGSANRWFQIMDATFPSVATNVLTAKSTFASGDGNFTWAEFGSDIGTPTVTSTNAVNACLVNRKVSAQGAKVGGQVWAATMTISFT